MLSCQSDPPPREPLVVADRVVGVDVTTGGAVDDNQWRVSVSSPQALHAGTLRRELSQRPACSLPGNGHV